MKIGTKLLWTFKWEGNGIDKNNEAGYELLCGALEDQNGAWN